MKKIILSLLLAFLSVALFAQEIEPDDDGIVKIFTKVEKEAKFPGGLEGWRAYLEKNLRAELAGEYIPLKKRQKSAQRTVTVQFVVNKEGRILQVRAIHKPNDPAVHSALIYEAIRVIKEGLNWIPAEQNNRKVHYQVIQNITFMVAR